MKRGFQGKMYLDTDVILAVLKEDDWLQSKVDLDKVEDPKTSAITITEIQLVYEDWATRFDNIKQKIEDLGIEILGLNPETVQKSSKLQKTHEKLNVFDSIHLAHAEELGDTIISTDTLYPEIEKIKSEDPRNLE